MPQKINLELVRRDLKHQGKTQLKLAEHLGVTTNTMVNIFDKGVCRTDQLEQMAEFLETGVAAYVVITDDEDRHYTRITSHIDELKKSLTLFNHESKADAATIARLENLVNTQVKYIKLLEEKLENVNQK